MSKTAFKNPERIQLSLISKYEKQVLLWIAKKLPAAVHPDHLTILGLTGMIIAGAGYVLARWNLFALLLAVVGLAINWFGDSLDGTVARVRNRGRPRYGFYVDHIIDAFGILVLFSGLGFSGMMDPWIAAGLLIAYYLLSIEIYLATVSLGKFRLSFGIFGPTELRILLAIGTVSLFFRPNIPFIGNNFRLFDVGGVIGIVALICMALFSAIKNSYQLYQEESTDKKLQESEDESKTSTAANQLIHHPPEQRQFPVP
jgi:phosphatidylglycerophosphate synthase